MIDSKKYELLKIDLSETRKLIFNRNKVSELIPELLNSIKANLNEIETLFERLKELEEDDVYRFYHQSFKVFGMQDSINKAVILFQRITPQGILLNTWFAEIVNEALSKEFSIEKTNPNWRRETRCIVEAFWHCKYFLEQMSIYGKELETPPSLMPSGWASVLYLYNLR